MEQKPNVVCTLSRRENLRRCCDTGSIHHAVFINTGYDYCFSVYLHLTLIRRNTAWGFDETEEILRRGLKLNKVSVLIISAVLANAAMALDRTGTNADYGTVVRDASFGRMITPSPMSKYINVTNGETVSISANGKTFSWQVRTFPHESVFDLSKVAPQDVSVPDVKVYVAPDPGYLG